MTRSVFRALPGTALLLLLLGSAPPGHAAFEPPRVIFVVNPDGAGQPTQAVRTYYIDKGVDNRIDRGALLNVYREKRGVPGGPAVRMYIGTMKIKSAEPDMAMGHFTPNEVAMANPGIRHQTSMKTDIAVPVLIIEADVLFDAQSISLNPAAAQEFQRVLDFINEYEPDRLVVECHTDAAGDAEVNQALSEARGAAVRQYMIETFPTVTPDMIESRGYGGRRPVAPGDAPEDQALNRRIEVIIWD